MQELALWALPVLAAVVFHEVAHGWAARRLGDDTAWRAGRLTLNPLAHADPVGTVVLPLLLLATGAPFVFGYARPVPVEPANFRRPRRDFALVALAGPAANLLLAGACGLALHGALALAATGHMPRLLAQNLHLTALMATNGVLINVALAVFNLIPIPPLDGGRVAVGVLPRRAARRLARLEPFGMAITVALIMTGVLGRVMGPAAYGLARVLLPA